jgi:hypothetical protein
VSAGIHKTTWTTHHFYEARPIVGTDEFEFIFACFKTGAKRRWGTYHREFLQTTVEPPVKDAVSVAGEPEPPFTAIVESQPSENLE